MVNTFGTVVVLPKKPPCTDENGTPPTQQEKQDYKNLVIAKRNSTQSSRNSNISSILSVKRHMTRRARKPGVNAGSDTCQ